MTQCELTLIHFHEVTFQFTLSLMETWDKNDINSYLRNK